VLHLASTQYIFHAPVLGICFVDYYFGEIMCIRDSYVHQEGVLCFLIHESYVRSVRGYCFVRNYIAIPVNYYYYYYHHHHHHHNHRRRRRHYSKNLNAFS
jgi:hypothetical protein